VRDSQLPFPFSAGNKSSIPRLSSRDNTASVYAGGILSTFSPFFFFLFFLASGTRRLRPFTSISVYKAWLAPLPLFLSFPEVRWRQWENFLWTTVFALGRFGGITHRSNPSLPFSFVARGDAPPTVVSGSLQSRILSLFPPPLFSSPPSMQGAETPGDAQSPLPRTRKTPRKKSSPP